MKLLLSTVITIIFLCACNNNDIPEGFLDIQTFHACDTELDLDSLEVINRLIGEWQWEFMRCYSSPDEVFVIDTEYRVKLNPDMTMEIREQGEKTIYKNWNLRPGFKYLLDVDTFTNDGFHGQLHFCNDQMVFANSYIDACDMHMRRIE